MRNPLGRSIPQVAQRLNNLAQLLNDTKRLAEAEPLMRQGFGDRREKPRA